jgi:hypothetical protein
MVRMDRVKHGVCKGLDTDLFFDPEMEHTAKAYCNTCPVQLECLAIALGNKEPGGIWGGLNGVERITFRGELEAHGKLDSFIRNGE